MIYRKGYLFLFCCYWLNLPSVFAQQQKNADSLAIIYYQNKLTDTAKLSLLRDLSFNELQDLAKGLMYAEELILLAEQMKDNAYLRMGYFLKGTKKRMLGSLDEALAAYIKSIEIAIKIKNLRGEGEAYSAIGDIYSEANNYPNALIYYRKAYYVLNTFKNDSLIAPILLNTGDVFLKIGNPDSAFLYATGAKILFDKIKDPTGIAYSLGNIGMVYASIGKNKLAEQNINEAIAILEGTQDYYPICVYLISMADVYLNKGDNKAALNYTLRSLGLAEQNGLKQQIADASLKLSELYEKDGKFDDAYKYYKNHIENRDSINNISSVQTMADLRTNYEVSQKQLEVNILNEQKRNQNILVLFLGIILSLALFILLILLRNNQNKQKAYRILNLQKQETELQKAKAEDALTELQLTQKHLIQSAKMASLGELTAGIAHEIKNPLNFVNNFSEVSVELVDELREGALKKLSAPDQAEAALILNDIADNLKKILHHGQRADSIVKGMLQHSRPSTGKRELTDINALASEYLRLSYNGLSAKDKFNINFTSAFDESIGRIEVVYQDMSSVLLNLFNNAFYSVLQKKEKGIEKYEPLVSVTTKRDDNEIEIYVKDNGSGIRQGVIDKIFQPFFTTKPTGQGTGLGLSLSYDIIKAHRGELKVETKEGEFAVFIIRLPIGHNHEALI